jgi:hypothetical protein
MVSVLADSLLVIPSFDYSIVDLVGKIVRITLMASSDIRTALYWYNVKYFYYM